MDPSRVIISPGKMSSTSKVIFFNFTATFRMETTGEGPGSGLPPETVREGKRPFKEFSAVAS